MDAFFFVFCFFRFKLKYLKNMAHFFVFLAKEFFSDQASDIQCPHIAVQGREHDILESNSSNVEFYFLCRQGK